MASWLDPYREEIEGWKWQGVRQAEMIRLLKERHGVDVKPQTLSDYLKKLSDDEVPAFANGAGVVAPAALPMPGQDVLAKAVMQGAGAQMIEHLVQVTEGLQQLKEEGDARHGELVGMFQDMRVVKTVERLRIWGKALGVTGAAWGVVALVLHYWR